MKILYIAYWGLLEPLGQSLILPAIRQMALRGVRIDLITFDKPADLQREDEARALKSSLAKEGVRWVALRYHKRPTIPATLYDILQGIVVSIRRGRPDVIHGRTFIGGVIGVALKALIRAPFVFHDEGFWTDQQVEGGFWRKGSAIYRICKAIETRMYESADGVIVLSNRARPLIEALPGVKRKKTPVIIVPSCVDLERFIPGDGVSSRLIYIGSLGGRYLIEPVGEFFRALKRIRPETTLEVYSQSDHSMVRSRIESTGVSADQFIVDRVAHEQMPEYLRRAGAGMFFMPGGVGTESSSPTKIGEYWACGLPVVTTPRAGHTEEIVEKYKVGVIIKDLTPPGYATAARDLDALLKDPEIKTRCRLAAEEYYSLRKGVDDQIDLYQQIIDPEK